MTEKEVPHSPRKFCTETSHDRAKKTEVLALLIHIEVNAKVDILYLNYRKLLDFNR